MSHSRINHAVRAKGIFTALGLNFAESLQPRPGEVDEFEPVSPMAEVNQQIAMGWEDFSPSSRLPKDWRERRGPSYDGKLARKMRG